MIFSEIITNFAPENEYIIVHLNEFRHMNDSLMKGISLLAVIAFTSCSHDAWFQTNDKVKQEADQYSSNFKTIVLGGQDADARQTWNTAVSTQITRIKLQLLCLGAAR